MEKDGYPASNFEDGLNAERWVPSLQFGGWIGRRKMSILLDLRIGWREMGIQPRIRQLIRQRKMSRI